eukprot:g3345.t1
MVQNAANTLIKHCCLQAAWGLPKSMQSTGPKLVTDKHTDEERRGLTSDFDRVVWQEPEGCRFLGDATSCLATGLMSNTEYVARGSVLCDECAETPSAQRIPCDPGEPTDDTCSVPDGSPSCFKKLDAFRPRRATVSVPTESGQRVTFNWIPGQGSAGDASVSSDCDFQSPVTCGSLAVREGPCCSVMNLLEGTGYFFRARETCSNGAPLASPFVTSEVALYTTSVPEVPPPSYRDPLGVITTLEAPNRLMLFFEADLQLGASDVPIRVCPALALCDGDGAFVQPIDAAFFPPFSPENRQANLALADEPLQLNAEIFIASIPPTCDDSECRAAELQRLVSDGLGENLCQSTVVLSTTSLSCNVAPSASASLGLCLVLRGGLFSNYYCAATFPEALQPQQVTVTGSGGESEPICPTICATALRAQLDAEKQQRQSWLTESSAMMKEVQMLRQRLRNSQEESGRWKSESKNIEEEFKALQQQQKDEEQKQQALQEKVARGREALETERLALSQLQQSNRSKEAESGSLERERQRLAAEPEEAEAQEDKEAETSAVESKGRKESVPGHVPAATVADVPDVPGVPVHESGADEVDDLEAKEVVVEELDLEELGILGSDEGEDEGSADGLEELGILDEEDWGLDELGLEALEKQKSEEAEELGLEPSSQEDLNALGPAEDFADPGPGYFPLCADAVVLEDRRSIENISELGTDLNVYVQTGQYQTSSNVLEGAIQLLLPEIIRVTRNHEYEVGELIVTIDGRHFGTAENGNMVVSVQSFGASSPVVEDPRLAEGFGDPSYTVQCETISHTDIPSGREWQSVRLRPCPAGEHRISYAGVGCLQCLPGYYKSGVGPALFCDPCELGFYMGLTGAGACTPCPPHETTQNTSSREIAACDCAENYFRRNSSVDAGRNRNGAAEAFGPGVSDRAVSDLVRTEDWTLASNHGVCEPCPYGAICEGGSVLPYSAPGFWTPDRLVFWSCFPDFACLQGNADDPNLCQEGRVPHGRRCGRCAAQTYVHLSECRLCGLADRVLAWVGPFLVPLLTVLIFLPLLIRLLRCLAQVETHRNHRSPVLPRVVGTRGPFTGWVSG